ncbi:N-acetylglucosamine-1-phosphodiester alpha-N-acetylglucosaminidase-like [Tubulanus polymorphus]|uniref:N-acetylglucosamine-1-phosphodiester alpha-N-acetylglucosaminidase-like n=1 Tax=Tubulanus polymorphus TaxID=672921 RepID=UPI003DA4A796
MAAATGDSACGQFLFIVVVFDVFSFIIGSSIELQDILLPYLHEHNRPKHSNRYVRDCQHVKYKNVTHELYPAQTFNSTYVNNRLPIVKTYNFRKDTGPFYNQRTVYGHFNIIQDPTNTVTVLEPGGNGGCKNKVLETVKNTAKLKSCICSTNAGLFNTHDGSCLGNVISAGCLVRDSHGIQNAHFGITRNNSLFFGYLSENDLLDYDFSNLVGGVIWLVRKGESYVDASLKAECSDTEETGTLSRFVNVISARTAIGHDKLGRILMVHVDGKTDQAGINLYDFAKLLIGFGAVNAINLDGGGSSTMVINDTVVNYPSDVCDPAQRQFLCERKISTIVCAHSPDCPSNCSNHGVCINGQCTCHKFWSGHSCNVLKCHKNCSNHGNCTEDGCICSPGFAGKYCNKMCPKGYYGSDCKMICHCKNGGICNPVNGFCDCLRGYTGFACDRICPYGTYGYRCRGLCYCHSSCTCNPFTGACFNYNQSSIDHNLQQTGQCLADRIIKSKNLVKDHSEQYRLWVIALVVISIMAAVSIILNISMLCMFYRCEIPSRNTLNYRKFRKAIVEPRQILIDDDSDDSNSSYDISDATSDEIFKPLKMTESTKLINVSETKINALSE